MNASLRLVIFDIDGTLVDSQDDIVAAMQVAFDVVGADLPDRSRLLSIVGLSLDVAMPVLAPDLASDDHAVMVRAYKDAYMTLRAQVGVAQSSPLYPGALDTLKRLHAVPDILLGVATGKSQRGLEKLIEGHGLEQLFVTRQVADFHPSKPHPSMILQALDETGVQPDHAVMVGDTSFDMDMAAAAGVRGIGVNWGYHPRAQLANAACVIDGFDELPGALDAIWNVCV